MLRFKTLSLFSVTRVFSLLAIFLIASPASAHVKWFIDPDSEPPVGFEPYSFSDIEVQIWMAIATIIIIVSAILDSKIPALKIGDKRVRRGVRQLFRYFTGMSLLFSAYEGNLIAPHMPGYGWFGMLLIYLQAFIGLMFISKQMMHTVSLMIPILFLGVAIQYDFVSVLEYCHLIGIGLFFYILYLPSNQRDLQKKLKPYAVDILRIFTGVALATLGVTEKLTGAALGQAFIAQHQWNFMPLIGMDFFTDRLFVLSAGIMEVVFGIILIIGTVTRINIFVIFCVLITTNLTFVVLNNNGAALLEIIGHFPILGSALILLLYGAGHRLKLTNFFLGTSGRTIYINKFQLPAVRRETRLNREPAFVQIVSSKRSPDGRFSHRSRKRRHSKRSRSGRSKSSNSYFQKPSKM